MMMAGIVLSAPSVPMADATPAPQPASDKGQGFGAAFADAAPPDPVEARDRAGDKAKDKDRRADKRRDDDAASDAASATPQSTQAPARSERETANDKGTAPRAVATGASGSSTDVSADQGEPGPGETSVDAAQLAPVLEALKQLASAQQQAPAAVAPPESQQTSIHTAAQAAAEPLAATASLLAARVVPGTARPASAKKSARAETADKTASIETGATPVASSTMDPFSSRGADGAVGQPGAGGQLAAGTADRALDMAKQGAWLDGLARDIAATGDSSSTLRFQAAPTHLGAVQVEIVRSLEGAAVTLTASSESSRSALADAKPQLIAEARAQGIHIASAQIDVSTDTRQSNTGGQPDPRHDPRGSGGFSSQSGGDGRSGGQSQTRSQPFAVSQTAEGQSAATTATDESAADSAPAGGMYA